MPKDPKKSKDDEKEPPAHDPEKYQGEGEGGVTDPPRPPVTPPGGPPDPEPNP